MAYEQEDFNVDEGNNSAGPYILRLFITGASPNSIRAVENIKAICENFLAGNYELEIIDIHQQPKLAEGEDVIAVPLMIKKSPYPQRRLIGDMSDTQRVLKGLGLAANS
ncbi:circadian clock KaiB family protein [Mucilaginibacter phyllosphaerae]|uniref:Circadian clock protein KaiB n=1 Tax=Mucilaginibacter phyllosphaerae TaxID=1812349 RepID=A0A4Y8AJ61_9SPHI|nr:circadian clock KaiB family protein [Mucilaginibacter phyllosphaerae]MBB3967888.1 circadian clock protein KaiB [Mucilaginibacter phyllosphaerae]TEW69070.1 circadian clock protein KaiB [Mucilaginibacter phyllosphaerae]GGH02654.1 KaiB 1 [Mucilaginibacter phyllosphaerae]